MSEMSNGTNKIFLAIVCVTQTISFLFVKTQTKAKTKLNSFTNKKTSNIAAGGLAFYNSPL